MIESIFHEFGLTQYETKVYLALIELGESTTGQILEKANIHSGKIYQILKSLQNKGFVSEIVKNNIKRYTPTEPNEILEFFQEKRKKVDEQEKIFKEILPKLNKKINQKKEKVYIEIFTGLKGMKKAFEKEISRYKKPRCLRINGIIDYSKHSKEFVDYFQYNIFPKREKSQIGIRKIVDKNAKANVREKQAKIRLLKYSSIITFNSIGDLTIISIWTNEPLFITIESKEMAKGFRENFELLWKMAYSKAL
ncbi:TrmB family transcriptional regulator [Nanoarchaeota archaeon]